MKRLRVKHVTGFRYAGEASASYNEARMLPAHTDGQLVLTDQLDIHPAAAQHGYLDYWGTRVTAFEVLSPHHELSIVATSLVEVGDRPSQPRVQLSWEEMREAAASATAYVEQSRQTKRTDPPADVVSLGREIVAATADPYAAGEAITHAIGEAMAYVQGATSVLSTGAEAWAQRRGVCQDIAHVALGALRSVGIPARYVSGYLHPDPNAVVGETITGESHAWVEWFCGEWVGYDPTNQLPIGDRHVLVGRGRDYDDVAPIRGVYAGTESSELFVSVEITRES